MFFLAATLVGWIGGDFVHSKVAAKNGVIFYGNIIFILSTASCFKQFCDSCHFLARMLILVSQDVDNW